MEFTFTFMVAGFAFVVLTCLNIIIGILFRPPTEKVHILPLRIVLIGTALYFYWNAYLQLDPVTRNAYTVRPNSLHGLVFDNLDHAGYALFLFFMGTLFLIYAFSRMRECEEVFNLARWFD